MNKDVFPVAELNLPSTRSGKFSWDLNPAEVANTSRKHRSDPPEFHIQLGTKNDNTVLLTSTPKTIDPINVPLPESPEISWDSENSLQSNSKPKVIIKQPNSSISPVSVDKVTDKPPNYSSTAFATDVVLDLHALLSEVNNNINVPATIEADLIAAAPVVQNLPGIQLVVQGPVAQAENAGVGIIPVDIQPAPVSQGHVDVQPAPVVQGPVDAPPVIPLAPDGDNNNDSSEDESDTTMTDSVIASPTFKGLPNS